jgi:hypothetical protein
MTGHGDKIDLTETSGRLRREFGVTASYAQLWSAWASDRIPVLREGRRLRVNVADLPTIAAVFGASSPRAT